MMKAWFLELNRRNKLLAQYGLICLVIFFVLGIIVLFDSRELFGVSVWNKPMKFFISTTILFWTVGWIMEDLPFPKGKKIVSWGTVVCISAELILITYQAALAKQSHFNISSPIDGFIFGFMGFMIFLNSLFYIYLFILFLQVKELPSGYKTGILFGLFIFLLGGYEGYLMAGRLSHTVGAADGQEGIFFMGWAKAYGDLRIFHFLAIHALQVLSLAGWYLFRTKALSMWILGIIYLVFSSGTLWFALQGQGFFKAF